MAFLKILFCDYIHFVCLVYIIAPVKFSSKTVSTYSEFQIICKSRGKLKDFSTLRPSNLFFFLLVTQNQNLFFYLLLGCPTQNFGYFQGNGFTHMMLIYFHEIFQTKNLRETDDEVGLSGWLYVVVWGSNQFYKAYHNDTSYASFFDSTVRAKFGDYL